MNKKGSAVIEFILIAVVFIAAASAIWYYQKYRGKDLRLPAPTPYSLDQIQDTATSSEQ